MRYLTGEQYTPKVGPHAGHVLQVADVEAASPKHDRVRIACQSCQSAWRFVHHWGRFA